MSTEEQERLYGRAFLERKEAAQLSKCLSIKLNRMRQSLSFVLRLSDDIAQFQDLEVYQAQFADYPSRDDLLALASEIRSVQQDIARLDEELK